ncbi:MAG: GGDEF domain-containing protein [Roseburia sp.]|nr:GGDEF domain-containing protein [Roseburia sp.]
MKKMGRLITSFLSIFFLMILFTYVFVELGDVKRTEGYYVLDSEWDVSVRDTFYEDVNLNELSFPLTKRGDIVTYERTLPEKMVEGTVMQFYVTHATVEVSVGGELIYEYGKDLYDENRMLGYGYHFVDIPHGSAGKQVKITLCVSEKDAFANLDAPELDNGAHIMRNFVIDRRVAAAVILFLVVFGFVFILATVFFSFKGADFYRLLNLAFFALCIGIWNLCNYDIIMVFTYNLQVKGIIEFSAIYGAPTFLFGYFIEEALKGGKLQKYIYLSIYGVQIAFVAIASILQGTRTVHFPQMLKYNQMIMACMAVYLLVILAKSILNKEKNHTVLMVGMVIMVLIAGSDIVRYNLQLYFGGFKGGHFKNYTYLGIFIFVLSLMVDFMRRTSATLYSVARNETLEKMAYTDALTGLLNRRRCEEIYDEIDKKKSDYAVIALDLNNLKKVNDSLGHEAGDLYLREFSVVLSQAFADCGDVIRTGGDEFLVVIKNPGKVDIEEKITKMNGLIGKLNECHANWNMSTAYGICYGNEEEVKNIREADRVADARMYEKKHEMKGMGR